MIPRLLLLLALALGLTWAPVSSLASQPVAATIAASTDTMDHHDGGCDAPAKRVTACHQACAVCHAALPAPPETDAPTPIRMVLTAAEQVSHFDWLPSLEPPPPRRAI